MKGYRIELLGEKAYPNLYALMGGSFNQDYDKEGETLTEIIASFRSRTPPQHWREVRSDIERFMGERVDDEQLSDDFERMFRPDIIPEGWEEGMVNWRQWLARVAQLLE